MKQRLLIKDYSIPFLLLLCGLYLVPISIFELDFSKIPGDFGDARFNNYILEHGYKFITGRVNSYWDAPFMFPYKSSISFSDNLLGTVPIYSIYRILNFSRETSFQLWLLTMFLLNYTITYFVLKKWSQNSILAAVGSYIFAFSILLVGNIYNVQTMPRFIIPLLFYWGWLYLKEKKIIHLYGLGIGLVYQFYCGIYLGFFTFYVLIFFVISYFLVFKDKEFLLQFKQKTILLKTLVAITVSSILLLPLMIPYFENSKINGFRSFEEVIATIPTIRSYFFTSKEPILWQILSEHGTKLNLYWCHFLFIGALPWIAIMISPIVLFSKKVTKSNKQLLLVIILGLALSMFFTLNFNSWTPYKLIYKLPGFSSMRSINRIINTEILYFILILVFVFKELITINKNFKLIILILPILVVFDNLIYPQKIMRFDKKESINEINFVKKNILLQNIKHLPNIAYLPLKNIEDQNIITHLNVMLATQELGLSCINAYSGSLPKGLGDFCNKMDYFTFNEWLKICNYDPKNVQIINDIGLNEINREQIALQSVKTSKYMCTDQSVGNQIIANRDNAYGWETYDMILLKDSNAILISNNKLFLNVQESDSRIIASKDFQTKNNFLFKIIKQGGNNIALKTQNNQYLYVNTIDSGLYANSNKVTEKELFIMLKK